MKNEFKFVLIMLVSVSHGMKLMIVLVWLLVMLIFSEMPACLRSVDSPDFDLLILQDGESHPEYVSGAYEFEVIG